MKPDGVALIEFWADDYKGHNLEDRLINCIKKYFGDIQFRIDEVGHDMLKSPDSLEIEERVPNNIRFVILKMPKL